MADSSSPPPPLPLEVRDRILSHLLPPTPPLPPELLSRAFIERLTFLPPSPSDLDAQLTPLPPVSTLPHPLTDALSLLVGSLTIGETQYAHDGEMTIAHTVLTPEHGDGAVEINFEHEAGDKGRGWVYSGAKLNPSSSAFDWRNDVSEVGYGYGEYGGGDAPEDYWAGFTPPTEHADLAHADEDDYWAQYGAGVPDPEPRDEREENENESERAEPTTPPSATIAAPDPASTLTLLLQGFGTDELKKAAASGGDDTEARSASFSSASPSDSKSAKSGGSVLEQKVRAKTRAQLMRAWTDFSNGADAESAAYDWLRLGREVADRPSWGSSPELPYADARTAVVAARLEAAKDIHDMLDEEEGAFWRLVEEAIRIHTNPVGGDEPQEYES